MFEFLVETYASYQTPSAAARHLEDLALAAQQVSETGAEVRLLRAIFVPEDDISFYLFHSPSADAVREAMTRAGLRSDRITKAVFIEAEPSPVLEERYTNDDARR